MGHRTQNLSTYRLAYYVLAGVTLLLVAGGFLMQPLIAQFFIDREKADGAATLRVVANGIDQSTQRFDPLPELIAERQSLIHILSEPGNDGLIPFVNEQLRLTAQSVGASDIFLMDPDGLTIAASNYRRELSFVGDNFGFRPYFQEAVSGKSASFHALGATSDERGFFYAAPVLDGIAVQGVIAVKVTVDEIEQSWQGLSREIAIADPDGVIFMSTRPDWRFRTLAPLTEETVDRIEETRQFPLERILPLSATTQIISPGAVEMQVRNSDGIQSYIVESQPLSSRGWHAIVFSPVSPAQNRTWLTLLVWTLAVIVLALMVFVALQWRSRLAERMLIQQAERENLEQRVRARTADLNKANAELRHEVDERKTAETKLKQAQARLVQAGKLAALGQMSAAISHEINQPLAAVMSYAENAKKFLERKRTSDAKDNIQAISDMTERMSRISGHLRNFARRPTDTLKDVEIVPAIEQAINLVEPRLRGTKAKIVFNRPREIFVVKGGPLRLQQVLVNLFNNALDAMEDESNPIVDVEIEAGDETIAITVRDHGPGLSADVEKEAFEPFFSTKKSGEGLGLGLSISYNIIEDFGGTLSARNHEDGGALFTVSLQRVLQREEELA